MTTSAPARRSAPVTVYVPPKLPQAIIFAGDGQRISKWGRLLEMADVPSTMIVGVHGLTDERLRLHEYSRGFDPVRFASHEKFFVEDVRRWTESRLGVALPTERTAVFGVSAGGELALALGLRHPRVYGSVFCASPGSGYKPPGVMPSPLPRTYLVAGIQEPFFLENARTWTCRPPSYSNVSVTNSPTTAPVGLAIPPDSLSLRLT